ncbi:MAG: serine/threonine-protein kinase [Kofleriaceae bacterium]
MASTPTTRSDQPPRRDPAGVDDTVPAVGDPVHIASRPTSIEDEQPPIRPTIPIDRYRIGKELGRGGMGRVVEAFDVQLGRTVALKEVLQKAGGGTSRRFVREIQITARLEHASIVPLYDSGISLDGKPYYVMRKVTGKPLDEMMARCRGLDERLTLLPAVLAAINAVAHAHTRGVIHRDLKPANILVGDLGETTVIDWGLAKVVGEVDEEVPDSSSPSDSLRTQIGSVFGTPGFMAPEQARGEAIDLEGDVYALGAVLYQLLSGLPPVAGVSATEVMDKTRTHDIRPLAETAPGAPKDLVTIVSKALEFAAADRYPDAGALGEDVRRFLAGQLVAAHDYTKRERIARFARRHRAALSVLALAAVAVAIMAWIGVHRILTERDAADSARHEAIAGKREAEQARDDLAERHDALVVMQARSLVEQNPTEAIGVLKQLSAKSPRIEDARAIAQAATTRGVAWSLQTTNEVSTIVALDPTGKMLLQVSRDGYVRVFDLERRRLLVNHAFVPMARADWVAGGKLLVTDHASKPQLFDPTTNTVEELVALEPMAFVRASRGGELAVFETPAKTAGIYDAATRTVTMLEVPEPVGTIEIAQDGSWVAVGSTKRFMLFDRQGKELLRRDGHVARIAGSRTGRIAVIADGSQVFELVLDPAPVWTELPIAQLPMKLVLDIVYRGNELELYTASADIMGWTGTRLFQRSHVDRIQYGMQEAADSTLVVPSTDGKVYWINEVGRGALVLPGVVSRLRLAARYGASRVAVIGDGVLHVFDLDAVLPRRIKSAMDARAIFIDDDTLLSMRFNDNRWEWIDLVTNKRTAIEYDGLNLPMLWDVDQPSGRVLVRDHTARGDRYVLLRKGVSKIEVVVDGGAAPWARLVPGDAIIYGLGDPRLFAKVGDQPAREIAKLDGMATFGTGLGNLTYAAHGSTGEVVRGDLITGKLERVRVPIGASGFLTRDLKGRVLIIEDNRLLLWDTAVTEVARLDKPIRRVDPIDGGVAITAGNDNEVYTLALEAGAIPHRVAPSSVGVATSFDGKLLASLGSGQNITIVELPSRARWTLPQLATAQQAMTISPTTRRILQSTEQALAIWQLPHVGNDFPAWLDSQTNATVDVDGVLTYPWQTKP